MCSEPTNWSSVPTIASPGRAAAAGRFWAQLSHGRLGRRTVVREDGAAHLEALRWSYLIRDRPVVQLSGDLEDAQPGRFRDRVALMADAGDAMNAISSSDLVTQRTAESFSVLDVAGINYAEARYALDRNLFPNRIIVGSETFPTRIDGNWRLVKQHGNVIGDFTWTGWDYLGEVGIGRPAVRDGGRNASRLHGTVSVAAGGLRRH